MKNRKNNTKQLCSGDILLASDLLNGSYFDNAVILLAAVDSEGVFGLIINRSVRMPVRECFDGLGDEYQSTARCMYVGGPVDEESLHMVSLVDDMPDVSGKEIVPGVFLGGHWLSVEELLETDECKNRLHLGYTGWDFAQLEGEIREGSWSHYKDLPIPVIFEASDLGTLSSYESTKDFFQLL